WVPALRSANGDGRDARRRLMTRPRPPDNRVIPPPTFSSGRRGTRFSPRGAASVSGPTGFRRRGTSPSAGTGTDLIRVRRAAAAGPANRRRRGGDQPDKYSMTAA